MGEYAMYGGASVKIGTCEDMLYLRADQAHLVTPEYGSVDPVADAEAIRFRFPFPDEDGTGPGAFDDAFRGLTVWGVAAPEGVDHGTVQFKADNGYLISLPCPEVPHALYDEYTCHRNGYGGAVEITQQRYWDGMLVTVCRCKGCGAVYRLPSPEDAQPVMDALHAMADSAIQSRSSEAVAVFYRSVADRMANGYALPGLAEANDLAEF